MTLMSARVRTSLLSIVALCVGYVAGLGTALLFARNDSILIGAAMGGFMGLTVSVSSIAWMGVGRKSRTPERGYLSGALAVLALLGCSLWLGGLFAPGLVFVSTLPWSVIIVLVAGIAVGLDPAQRRISLVSLVSGVLWVLIFAAPGRPLDDGKSIALGVSATLTALASVGVGITLGLRRHRCGSGPDSSG